MPTFTIPITNPNLDQGFYNYQDKSELLVATGWTPYWTSGTKDAIADGYLVRPEFKPEHQRSRFGKCGQKFFTTFATHDAGLYQEVNVPEGAILTLEAEVQYWSKHTDSSGGGYAMCVGIDPFAHRNPDAPYVAWGQWIGQDSPGNWDGHSWRTAKGTAVATGPTVTIYLRGACRFRAKHNDSYWDCITLTAEVASTPTNPDYKRILELLQSVLHITQNTNRGLAALFKPWADPEPPKDTP